MKKLIYLLAISLATLGCVKEPEKPFTLDPLATVKIKPEKGAWAKTPANRVKAEQQYLSALEIVEQTTILQFYNPRFMINNGYDEDTKIERTFDVLQRDLNPDDPKLMMWATDVISEKGELIPDFIEGENFILLHFDLTVVNAPRDTIGYIPNSVIRAAETAVKAAYADNDPEEVLHLFNEAFTFRPTTGAEYKALKESGNN